MFARFFEVEYRWRNYYLPTHIWLRNGIQNHSTTANISRTTYYKYYNSDEQFKEQVKSIGDEAIDFVESQLFELIKNGNIAATIFFLKTKGKKRGYSEKQEFVVDENLNIKVDWV